MDRKKMSNHHGYFNANGPEVNGGNVDGGDFPVNGHSCPPSKGTGPFIRNMGRTRAWSQG